MKATLSSLILLAVVSINTIAQDTSQWGLPEGAKARLGRGRFFDLKYSPDGTRVAAPSSTGIWLYDSATGDPVSLMRIGNVFATGSVAFSPDSRTLASFSGVLRLWDTATGELKHTMRAEFGSAGHVAFSPDGRTLASGHISPKAGHSSGVGKIGLWDAVTGERKLTVSIRDEPVSLAYSPDGRTLAVGHLYWSYAFGSSGWVTLRDATTGELKHELRGHAGGVYSLAYSADGRTLASGSAIDKDTWWRGGATVQLWDAATGAHLRSLEAYVWEVDSLALSPDGGTLAVASRDGRFTLWDTATGTQKRQVEGHTGGVNSVAFSVDGNTLASAGGEYDGTVRLWDARTGAHKQTLVGSNAEIVSVAFSF